ncbi:MAG: GyrI-like domain-containing protein [Actinomycetota bacterium]
MLDTPEIAHSDAQQTAVIRFVIPRDEIQHVMGPAIAEVMGGVTTQGIGPAGPVYSRHFQMSPDTWDFEVGVPVTAPVTPTGRVIPSHLPAAKVARAVYRGPYEALGEAWGELMIWIEAQGLDPAEGLWERYVAGPESGPDPANWRTELNRPLR